MAARTSPCGLSQHRWRQHRDVSPHPPPSTPSPAPQAPLGSQGTRGRKEALGLGGGGGPGRHPRGRPQPQECGETSRPPRNQGASGPCRAAWLTSTPVCPPIPAGTASCPLEVPSSLNPPLGLKLSPVSWPGPPPPAVPASWGQVLGARRVGNSLPSPSSGHSDPAPHPHGCPGEVTRLRASVSPSMKCRA